MSNPNPVENPIGKHLICPGSFSGKGLYHTIEIETVITDDYGFIAAVFCNLCSIEFRMTKFDCLFPLEEAKEILHKTHKALETKNKSECVCDFDTVIMTMGCQCGGK